MASGDSKRFSAYDYNSGLGTYNSSTDVFKWVILTDSFTDVDADAVTANLASFTQVASAGNYVANSTITSTVWVRNVDISFLDGDDFSFAALGSNPITGKSVLLYNSTSPNNDALAIIDLTTDGGTTPANTTQGFTYTVALAGIAEVTTNA